jgi:transposase InsO family protein
MPEHLRSDNGPEFIAYCIQNWLKAQKIKTLYIKPGSPWENGHIESFHDKLRDECLKSLKSVGLCNSTRTYYARGPLCGVFNVATACAPLKVYPHG